MIIWASDGILGLSDWAAGTVRLANLRAFPAALVERIVPWATGVAVVVISLFFVKLVWELRTFDQFKIVGQWLNAYKPGPKLVMDTPDSIPFYASASYLSFPYTDATTALRYIERKKVDFIVLTDTALKWTPYLNDWIDNGIPDKRAEIIFSSKTPILGRILIYR